MNDDCLGIREAVMLFYIPHIKLAMPTFEYSNSKPGIPLEMTAVFLIVVDRL